MSALDENTTMDDIYQLFGKASEASQIYEFALATVWMHLHALETGAWQRIDNPDEFMAKMEKSVERKTLGTLMRKVGELCRFEDSVINESLSEAVDTRNRLIHEFFKVNREEFDTSSGRNNKAIRLSECQEKINEAIRLLSTLLTSLKKLLSDLRDPNRREQIINEGYVNLAAFHSAPGVGRKIN